MLDELGALTDLFSHPGFVSGLVAGLGVLALLYVITRSLGRPVAGWGVLYAAAVLAVLKTQFEVETSTVVNLGLVAAGGWVIDRAHSIPHPRNRSVYRFSAWALAVALILVLTIMAETPDVVWVRVAFPLVVLALGAALRALREPPMAELVGPMVAVAVFGVWITVPETDMVRVLLGASLPMALATLPPVRARVTGADAFAAAALFSWLTMDGGAARPESIVGGWASILVLLLIPLVGLHRRAPSKALIFGVYALVAWLATRIADSGQSVVLQTAGIFLLALLSLLALGFIVRQPEVADVKSPEVS